VIENVVMKGLVEAVPYIKSSKSFHIIVLITLSLRDGLSRCH